ncbi:MAG: hypothetical protein EOO31_07435 [Comamonadaceae bacterium]|nr:MAG: hypothetical protein EOO31_07435 [Comamonadaceae bacterium]
MVEVKGGAVGASNGAVFFTTKKDLPAQAMATLGPKEKSLLGEHGRLIEKDKVASVHAAQDALFTTVITAKGLGDDIGVHAITHAAQQRIVASVQALMGRTGKVEQVRPGLLQRSGKSLFLGVAVLVITGLLHYVVSSMTAASVDLSGKHARKEELLYSIAHTLGPTGTLAVGGVIAALFFFSAYKNSKKTWLSQRYTF